MRRVPWPKIRPDPMILAAAARNIGNNQVFARGDTLMRQTSTSDIQYRGYTLTAVEHSPGWRVHIYPGQGRLRTHPDSVSAVTKEEAFAKARMTVDHQLSS
jgi:hypothetical protein